MNGAGNKSLHDHNDGMSGGSALALASGGSRSHPLKRLK